MQRARSNHPYGHRVRIASFVVAFLAAGATPLFVPMPASAATLDRVKQRGKLILGYRADARPFSYRDNLGNLGGYAVALCEEVTQKVKSDLGFSSLTVEWIPVYY